ncbi:hypothetical protein TREPR_1905 [Treponema primitia ZAS-2]|uniref:Uncharacterized protein n=1 Tax=Treponema primitia (strain ATCC BAA-887 / DSM 12427 / ZAS-2) TaxID=545694 RepID=F5YL30_TREPZ|nr:hypothetical protein [Treponema primitia]AEF85710.1 hypothetical protein TREPR_1905 [Treponema primitia ZAS-2]
MILNEVATIYSDDMIIEVYPDSGKIGDPINPAYAYLKNSNGDFLGKFSITKQVPLDKSMIFDCHKEPETGKLVSIPSEYKEKIVKWAIDKYPYNDDEDGIITNWGALKIIFSGLNPNIMLI